MPNNGTISVSIYELNNKHNLDKYYKYSLYPRSVV